MTHSRCSVFWPILTLSFWVQVCRPWSCLRSGHGKQEHPSSGAEAFPRHCLQPGRLQRPRLNLSQTPHSPGNQIHYAKLFYPIKNCDTVYPMCSGLQITLSVLAPHSLLHEFTIFLVNNVHFKPSSPLLSSSTTPNGDKPQVIQILLVKYNSTNVDLNRP